MNFDVCRKAWKERNLRHNKKIQMRQISKICQHSSSFLLTSLASLYAPLLALLPKVKMP